MIHVERPELLADHVNAVVTSPTQIIVNDAMIDAFTEISRDPQWIHSSAAKPRIVPGNLLIALVPRLLRECVVVDRFSRCLTVKYENIRFNKPVVSRDTLGLAATIVDLRTRFGASFLTVSINLILHPTSDEELKAVDTQINTEH
ncbi:MAG: MaoC family dehydratase, partial [Pseudomonadota bacterium]|nr:MaoC family dehydratase [Pseudomonadota bacterium]